MTNKGRGNQRRRGNRRNEETNGSMDRDKKSPRRMQFKIAEMLSDNENIEEVVQKLFDERAGFKVLLGDNDLSGDFLVLIVHILSKVSKSSFVATKVQIYETVFTNSTYIKQLRGFITSSPYHEQIEKRKNRYFWKDSDKFWYNLESIFKDMKSIPTLASQVLPKLLESIVITLPILENQQNIHISDDIKNRFQVLQQEIKNIESDMVKKYHSRKRQAPNNYRDNEDDWIPPNYFREIDVCPDIFEVATKQKPFLRKNKIVGSYQNIDHYLDVQFRLLREDFISPMREGICQYLKNPNEKNYDNIELYKVNFVSRENVDELKCFRIRFDIGSKKKLLNAEHSKQFMFGSLICFSNDRFLSLIFAKIVKSDPEMMKKGELIVELHEYENIVINYDSDYVMVESKVYFEPYFHVLKALQKITDDNFPFGRYLVQAKSNVYHPEYIKPSTRFTIDNREIYPMNWQYQYQLYGLNNSQENALRASLTREISVIQGPPGTGKTFLGLKIAHTLLKNNDCWYKNSPLLVICFTNHALDQFLEGVLKSTKKLLRIGGQSKNPILENYNLTKKMQLKSGAFYQAKRQVTICLEDMKEIDKEIDEIEKYKNKSILDFSFFRKFLEDIEDTWFHTAETKDIKKWLLQDANVHRIVPPINNNLTLEQLKRLIMRKHPHAMTIKERWDVYHNFQRLNLQYLMEERKKLNELYKKKYKIYTEQRNMANVIAMRESLVIGMTTTSAARLRPVLQALRSPIVIVEEAAEVLESHIISALTGHCKQLILLGDHQQLRPSTADYTIETKYQMGVSLFERMILNKIQCHTLNVQHRMTPEICDLIRPSIYPELKDHSSVFNRPKISGVDKSLFFITHNKKEESFGDSSKMNLHEVTFLINLAKYLILNGYEPRSLTILAAYSGQMLQLQKEKKKYSVILEDVRISVLDNYQGEESDIILLSLVRNNKQNKNGFLKNTNRVCVALSRARNGLYIMGNISQLCTDRDSIWPKIKQTLEQQNALGTSLKLKCQIHGVITEVKNDVDFSKIPDGGCTRQCGTVLSCGHVCTNICHLSDRDHKNYTCVETCGKILCHRSTKHVCHKLCYVKCGPCHYPFSWILHCGHEVTLKCHMDPNQYACVELVSTLLPCGHNEIIPCHVKPENFVCSQPCNTLPKCGHSCTLTCHYRKDPGHLNYKCLKQCKRIRNGCSSNKHKCRKLCHEKCEPCHIKMMKQRTVCNHVHEVPCNANVDVLQCNEPCSRILPCGHNCGNKCYESCGPCLTIVEKSVPECGHKIKIECYNEPKRQHCGENCERKLLCGHDCQNKCRDKCTDKCIIMKKCYSPSLCGHIVKQIKCFENVFAHDEILLKYCTEPCQKVLQCTHKCTGTCAQCFQGRIHVRCTQKCGVPLVCNHECPIPCREVCKPCEKKCNYKCEHGQCTKQCGEVCLKCTDECPRICIHQKCRRQCGDICDVKPCEMPCPKKLSCGHDCVGFCSDPCPKLCRICDKDTLLEKFFGTETINGVRFVELKDCGHIMESGGMQSWLENDNGKIQMKVCPKCNTFIFNTQRYNEFVKRTLLDINAVKLKLDGTFKEDTSSRIDLLARTNFFKLKLSKLSILSMINIGTSEMTTRSKRILAMVCQKDRLAQLEMKQPIWESTETSNLLDIDINKLKETISDNTLLLVIRKFEDRVRKINLGDYRGHVALKSIMSQIKIVEHIADIYCRYDSCQSSTIDAQINFLLHPMLRNEGEITIQEIEDVQLEISRLKRMVYISEMNKKYSRRKWDFLFFWSSTRNIMEKLRDIEKVVMSKERYSKIIDKEVEKKLKKLNGGNQITDFESLEIVKTVGFSKCHWFRCPNGHPYVITECGGAMQEFECPECEENIGITQHY